MSRKISFAVDEFYHLYNRGVDKRVVFDNDSDYRRFLILLYLCNRSRPFQIDRLPEWRGSASSEFIEVVFNEPSDRKIVAIGSYCLMPNHFHILVREIKEGGISEFMHRLSTAYTMYFNTSRERTGSLFQGRFKAEHVNNDRHLKYLYSYINLNPVKLIQTDWKEKGIKNLKRVREHLNSFPYSSYFDYTGKSRKLSQILSTTAFPLYFRNQSDFIAEVETWLNYEN
ncbi:MAG: hypothetical protein A3G52_03265 [Candidatus Taylorbacteria bacterium RIFCSPLOWO2_12_FULL_43_20]|uniref:Transposase IS200-like domain-containing protein n=1 Tax=Candidatus Taylorbacteria bacterium RIFCSPLOWO2_12_FULL_43_20 TaxID=1802332 RepID=A0A1G2P368_9BACT|nr:MAG: hypothetical protein A2825_03585 [Candidatus Taylorbacteria bacterium RIFCSPHIGHO2_01_FULL_43_120]OHA22031.1 MAG: hypothetical protein A3B98_03970 [Candidatus Taylorbacteria bacterium RIFCSPHIGHO2_02_FULL_43_55]OHA30390.1 MAG: hypothetical protein A3E92_00805 [Candidatus Taylorbacteria bacterium RIFCSPHIGHO2_12_FULL_42_34]OHA31528.1 MAG: hypothetical protein A3B09_00690 [Candidatus Taylorbacteria bacterium RIFCSPLOWO2_01_FULL_43_83]OHA39760.1 MAG: hypothetical protein A3H58_04885 [Candi